MGSLIITRKMNGMLNPFISIATCIMYLLLSGTLENLFTSHFGLLNWLCLGLCGMGGFPLVLGCAGLGDCPIGRNTEGLQTP